MNRKQTVQRCKKFLWGLLLTFASAGKACGDLIIPPSSIVIISVVPGTKLALIVMFPILLLCFFVSYRKKKRLPAGKILLCFLCLWLICLFFVYQHMSPTGAPAPILQFLQ